MSCKAGSQQPVGAPYQRARFGNVKVTKVIPPAMKLIFFGYMPVVFLTSLWPDLSLFLPRFFGYDVAP